MYVCICMYIYVCMYVYVYIYMCVCVCVYSIYAYVCEYFNYYKMTKNKQLCCLPPDVATFFLVHMID